MWPTLETERAEGAEETNRYNDLMFCRKTPLCRHSLRPIHAGIQREHIRKGTAILPSEDESGYRQPAVKKSIEELFAESRMNL